ncbi:hypothetical protein DCAR_0519710 [Daucus carota subsp. sativus]|uniref:Scarecrow-like protein 15 n=1 Tax=Daucus carota subsp. sativus TaxID=79200 RepID=A0AAF1B1N7_DAUCS|nr:PREDICTED: scarecrow-like protein 15 [Daucus carota subsp. sativus]WOH00351.1 hypothetical protein DCAR_0519710 [Daucus carota subsp. sativus]
MKVPFTSPQFETTHKFYEPKSVLDLRRSPSPPLADKPAPLPHLSHYSATDSDLTLHHLDQDEHALSHLEDWDSLMRDLGLHDDNNSLHLSRSIPQDPILPPPQHLITDLPIPSYDQSSNFEFTNFHSSFATDQALMSQYNSEFDFVDELIRLAECFETNSLQLAQAILAPLNHRLSSPNGKPLQRAAFYFKEALQSLLTGNTLPDNSSENVVQTIKAYRTFSNVSPIPMFANFTANQAILEAVEGAMIVHVIDFDIGFGGQWASFMREIAENRKSNPPVIRITAIVPEDYAMESRLMTENLCQFARELNIGFEIDFISVRTFEFLSFKSVKFAEGEKIAVLLSPTIFRRIGAGFVTDLRRISPHVVVHVDFEGSIASSFRQAVIEGLEFYSTVFESLEAANVGVCGGDWIRKIEMFVMLPKIISAMEAAGRRETPWREVFAGAGFRAVGLSQFADFQAECLLRRVQVRGFHVAKRQAEMVLCWHDRALVATSAWRF